jgi:hypothetical protein
VSTLKISINVPHLDSSYFPVTAEVWNTNMECLHTLIIHGEATIATIDPGVYLIRTVLPSGEVNTTTIEIKDKQEAAHAILGISPSPHEWLAWQQFLGNFRKQSRGLNRVNTEWPGHDIQSLSNKADTRSDNSSMKESIVTLRQNAWIRIWEFVGGYRDPDQLCLPYELEFGWQLEDISRWSPILYESEITPDLTVIHLSFPTGASINQRVLQFGGDDLPWRTIVMPPVSTLISEIEVLFRPSSFGILLDSGVSINLVTRDRETEVLSHYMDNGDYYNSATLANEFLENAERLLRDKNQNPYGAIVAGYYLLGVGDLERLRNWPNNFADWSNWLSDSAIIHAWQILLDSEIRDKSIARKRLIDAAHRGVPAFKQGLRYLAEGLQNFSSLAHQDKAEDQEVDAALKFVDRFTRATNWNQRLVTYYGKSPYEPSLNPVIGIPDQGSMKTEKKFSFVLHMSVYAA